MVPRGGGTALAAPAAKPLAAPATLARLAEAEAALFLEHGATLGALSLTEPLSAESRAMLRQRRREADVALGALLDAVRSDPGLPDGPALAAALAAVADSQVVIVLLRAGMDRPAPDRPAPSAIAWAEARARQEAAMAALRGLFWARLSLPAPPALPPPGPEAAPAGPQAAAPPAAAPGPRTATAGPAPGGRQPGWPWLAGPGWRRPAGWRCCCCWPCAPRGGSAPTRAAPRGAWRWTGRPKSCRRPACRRWRRASSACPWAGRRCGRSGPAGVAGCCGCCGCCRPGRGGAACACATPGWARSRCSWCSRRAACCGCASWRWTRRRRR
ncbi:hypothetical protein [Teichococcus aestuarii]|uniref:hypothetical protein n=1 Tax=Teichococcus aestuarii TaxID=568898 RepID=UPI00361FA57F